MSDCDSTNPSKPNDTKGALPISSLLSPPEVQLQFSSSVSNTATMADSQTPETSFYSGNSTSPAPAITKDSTAVFPSPVSVALDGENDAANDAGSGNDFILMSGPEKSGNLPSLFSPEQPYRPAAVTNLTLPPMMNASQPIQSKQNTVLEPAQMYEPSPSDDQREPLPHQLYGRSRMLEVAKQNSRAFVYRLRAESLWYAQLEEARRIRARKEQEERAYAEEVAKSRPARTVAAKPYKRRLEPKESRGAEPAVRREPRKRVKRVHDAIETGPDGHARRRVATPKQRAPPEKKVVAVKWDEVPDYSPPIEILHRNPLKPENKGNPLDMSTDPLVHLLHPSEAAFASSLRLSAETYLLSKRNVFKRRLEHLKRGQAFLKTHAQQACNIDVNKASKIWTAFEKVGWLDPVHFQKYLNKGA